MQAIGGPGVPDLLHPLSVGDQLPEPLHRGWPSRRCRALCAWIVPSGSTSSPRAPSRSASRPARLRSLLGAIWAKAAWNMYWDFGDKRLSDGRRHVVHLRRFPDISRGRWRIRGSELWFSAVFAFIASLNVPLVYFSVKWFGRGEPFPSRISISSRTRRWKLTRHFGAFAFLVLYTAWWRYRYRVLKLRGGGGSTRGRLRRGFDLTSDSARGRAREGGAERSPWSPGRNTGGGAATFPGGTRSCGIPSPNRSVPG